MAFRFSLATLLRYREALEQREHIALEKIKSEISAAEVRINEIQRKQLALAQARETGLIKGVTAIQLQSALNDEASLQIYSDDLKRQLQELLVMRQQRLSAFKDARQKREVLEKIRDRKLVEYSREQSKAEQAILDDLFLASQKRGR